MRIRQAKNNEALLPNRAGPEPCRHQQDWDAQRKNASQNEAQRRCRVIAAPIFLFALVALVVKNSTTARRAEALDMKQTHELSCRPEVVNWTQSNLFQNNQKACFQAISCGELLSRFEASGRVTFHGVTLTDPNEGVKYIPKNTTQKMFVSLHKKSFDRTRWSTILQQGEYYERVLTHVFKQILFESPPDARVIDVGGNIGWFSLWSRKLGRTVYTFEPNMLNILRMCESIDANDFRDGIDIFPYGANDVTKILHFQTHASNPGQGAIQEELTTGRPALVVAIDEFAIEQGWMTETGQAIGPEIAIFKVDIEGREPQAIQGAARLLASGAIRNVLMEISFEFAEEYKPTIRLLLESGFVIEKYGGYSGPDMKWPLAETTHPTIMSYVKENGGETQQLNFWWKIM